MIGTARNRRWEPAAAGRGVSLMLVDPGSFAAGSTVTGAIRQASQATGTSFSYLLATAQVESGTQSAGGRFDLLGARLVPVRRANLARHDEAIGRRARLRTLCRRHQHNRFRPLRGEGPGAAQPNPQAAQRSDGERGDGGRIHQRQCVVLDPKARPHAERGRALHRPFPRRRRRGAADLARREPAERQSHRLFRSRRARQSVDLL